MWTGLDVCYEFTGVAVMDLAIMVFVIETFCFTFPVLAVVPSWRASGTAGSWSWICPSR
jgi:hypothetical protein